MGGIDLGIEGLTRYEQVGSGGFATVYAAHEESTGRRVAVKLLTAVDESGRRRFDRERRNMGRTTGHPNIVTLFRSGYTDRNQPYLVMEYLPGGSMQDLLDAGRRLSADEAVAVVRAVADALGFSHRAGIVHRDVKPANILLAPTGAAKLSDFGIAAIQDATATSEVAYSMAYTPPETFQAGRDPASGSVVDPRDERSDLYSLAATFYALLTGGPPFRNEIAAALMGQILTEPVPTIGHRGLDRFFAMALAKDPHWRHRSADDFVADLDATLAAGSDPPLETVLAGGGPDRAGWPGSGSSGATQLLSGTPLPPPAPIGTVQAPSTRRSGPVLPVAAAVLAAATVAVGAWLGLSLGDAGDQPDGAAVDEAAPAPASAGSDVGGEPVGDTTVGDDDGAGSPVPGGGLAAIDLSGLSLTIASKDFTEQLILGEILVQGFTAAGADVTALVGFGGTAPVREQLLSGGIDLYPEYNGSGWTLHLQRPYDDLAGPDGTVDPDDLTEATAQGDLAENGVRWLGRTPFNDTFGFASGPDLLDQGQPFSFDSMASHLQDTPDAVVCVEEEFVVRPDGLVLFEEATGHQIPDTQLRMLEAGAIYGDLASGACDFGEVFTTDGRIAGLDLNLVDDQGAMVVYNASIIVSDDVYQRAPEAFDRIADLLLAPLDQRTMTELNRQVDGDGAAAADVARAYLEDHDLI